MEATKGSKEEIFSDLHYQLLLMSDYDINHGHNIIALPANGMDFFQPIHNLIQHPSNHANYTSRVIKEMKKLKKQLKKFEKNTKEDHPKISVLIAQTLRGKDRVEDLLWELLIKIGESIITGKVNKTKADLDKDDMDLVKYKAKSTGTNYKYGALS